LSGLSLESWLAVIAISFFFTFVYWFAQRHAARHEAVERTDQVRAIVREELEIVKRQAECDKV